MHKIQITEINYVYEYIYTIVCLFLQLPRTSRRLRVDLLLFLILILFFFFKKQEQKIWRSVIVLLTYILLS